MGRRFPHDFFVDFQTVCGSNRKAINAIENASLIILQQKSLLNKSCGNLSKFKRNSDFSAANHNKLSLVYMHKLGSSLKLDLGWFLHACWWVM